MLSLKKTRLQDSIEVDGRRFLIKTDFRYWLSFFDILRRKPFVNEFDIFYLDEVPTNRQKGIEELIKFANPKRELPRGTGGVHRKIMDYDIDADYIFAAFFEQYHLDLCDEKTRIHWWKFLALENGLHDTMFNKIMEFRSYDENDKDDYKKSQIKLRTAWEIREEIELTDEEKLLEAEFEKKANPK